MRRILSLFMLMLLCVGVGWAAETAYKTLTFPDDNKENNKVGAYNKSWTAKSGSDSWTIAYFNNNNWGWTNIRCGNKNAEYSASITTDAAIDKVITKVVVNVGTYTHNASTQNLTSHKLEVATDAGFNNIVQTINGTVPTASISKATDWTYEISTPTANCYYRLTYVTPKTSANGILAINSVTYYTSEEVAETLKAPTINPNGGTYTEGQSVEVTITANNEGASLKYSTDGETWSDYTAALTITESTTVHAKAVKDGLEDSPEATATFTFKEAEKDALPGESVIFDYTTNAEFAQSNSENMVDNTKKGVKIAWAQGTHASLAPKWYSSSNGNARAYAGNTITVTAPSEIESVTFAFEGNNAMSSPTVAPGSYNQGVWTVGAASGVLTVDGTTRISTITVKLAAEGALKAPSIAPAGGEFETGETVSVTITDNNDGASLKYSTDGETWSDYTAALSITETTTLHAKAVSGDKESPEATATFTFKDPITTIAALNALSSTSQEFTYKGSAVVLGQNGNYLYVADTDNSAGTLIFKSGGFDVSYNFGDVIPTGWGGTITVYGNAPEVMYPTNLVAATETKEIAPLEATLADVTYENYGRYAVIRGATLSKSTSGNNTTYTITVGEDSKTILNRLVSFPSDLDVTYDVYGVISYNSGVRFVPTKFEEVTIKAPTVFLNGEAPAESYTTDENGELELTLTIASNNGVENPSFQYSLYGESWLSGVVQSAKLTIGDNNTYNMKVGENTLYVHEVIIKSDARDEEGRLTDVEYSEFATITFTVAEPEKEVCAAPTFDPNGGTFTESVTVTIAADDNATINYSTDGENWLTYDEPITLTETTTLQAYAVQDGKEQSETVSATFTKEAAPQPSTGNVYKLITSTNDLEAGKEYVIASTGTYKSGGSHDFSYAGGDVSTSGYINAYDVEITDNTITLDADSKIVPFVLEADGNNWKLKYGNQYYTTTAVKKMSLGETGTAAGISFGNDGNAVINFSSTLGSIFCNPNNGSNPRFLNYAATTTSNNAFYVYLYKKVEAEEGLSLEEVLALEEETEVTIADELTVVEQFNGYSFATDGNGNWIRIDNLNADKTEVVKNIKGSYNGNYLKPTITATAQTSTGKTDDTNYVAEINLVKSFEMPQPAQVVNVTGYYDAYEENLRGLPAGGNGRGQSLTLDGAFAEKEISDMGFQDSYKYQVPVAIEYKEAMSDDMKAPRRASEYKFQNLTGQLLVSEAPNPIAVPTAIESIEAGAEVKSVRYIDLAGRELAAPAQGVNIVITTLQDGTEKTTKVVY